MSIRSRRSKRTSRHSLVKTMHIVSERQYASYRDERTDHQVTFQLLLR